MPSEHQIYLVCVSVNHLYILKFMVPNPPPRPKNKIKTLNPSLPRTFELADIERNFKNAKYTKQKEREMQHEKRGRYSQLRDVMHMQKMFCGIGEASLQNNYEKAEKENGR
uniref:Uncharacterized protein n=1 Tax=Micrurus corallinus TaxID=54390 RepID=A0A2D4GIC9_MICCO